MAVLVVMHLDQVSDAIERFADPIGLLVELAQDIGATTVAANARRELQRIDAARYFVDVVASQPALASTFEQLVGGSSRWCVDHDHLVELRHGRSFSHRALRGHARVLAAVPVLRSGASLTFGTIDRLGSHGRRVDAVVVDRAVARDLGSRPKWRTTNVLVVDFGAPDDVARGFEEVADLAFDAGAGSVVDDEEQCVRLTRWQVQNHLFELQRALRAIDRPIDRPQGARVQTLSIARTLIESILVVRGQCPDPDRQQLVAWLELERTKFLMSSKADALAELETRLASITVTPHRLRRASAEAHAVAAALLGKLMHRFGTEARRAMVAASNRLLADVTKALGDLAKHIPLHILALLERAPLATSPLRIPPPANALAFVTDRLGLLSKRRIASAAREQLVHALEHDSRLAVKRLVAEYDRSQMVLERRCCDLVDTTLESVRFANDLARETQVTGLEHAREQVAVWSATLAALDG